jgi:branched-chain amino acid transport system substrate-binding protein
MKKWCIFLFLITTIFLYGENNEIIKIVSSLPRTGSSNAQTTSIVYGIRIALEEVNYRVNKFKIVYEDWDDASAERGTWDGKIEAQNADRAIKDPDVMVYIGTYNSGAAKISMPKLNKAGLLMISPANTYPGLTKPGKGEKGEPHIYRPSGRINYFRVVPADDIQGVVAAHWAKQLGMKSVFILHDKELYGKGIADIFEKECKKIGIRVIAKEGIDPKALEYKGLMIKIKNINPDMVYFGGTTQSNAGQLVKDMRSCGVNCPIMVPDGCRENVFISSAGAENLNGKCYVTFGGLPPEKLTGKGATFYKRYKEKYKSEPEAYAVYGYEAARVALEAIRIANEKDRKKILEACSKIRDFDGALGKWSFDENGDTTLKIMSGEIVENGKFKFVRLLKVE